MPADPLSQLLRGLASGDDPLVREWGAALLRAREAAPAGGEKPVSGAVAPARRRVRGRGRTEAARGS